MTTIYLVVEETKFINQETNEIEYTAKTNWLAFKIKKDAEKYAFNMDIYNNRLKQKGIERKIEIQEIELD